MNTGIKFFPNAYYSEIIKSVDESDAAVHYVDWGFRLREIPCKVHLFHGLADRLVPPAFAKHLVGHIPKCELVLLENQGHLFPVDHQDLIFETAKLTL